MSCLDLTKRAERELKDPETSSSLSLPKIPVRRAAFAGGET